MDFSWCITLLFSALFFSFRAVMVQEGWRLMTVLSRSWQDTIWTPHTLFRPSLRCRECWSKSFTVRGLETKMLGSLQSRLLWHLMRGIQSFSLSLSNFHTDWCLRRHFLGTFVCFIQQHYKCWIPLRSSLCVCVSSVYLFCVTCNQIEKLWPTPTAKFTSWHSIWPCNYGCCSHQLAQPHLGTLQFCNRSDQHPPGVLGCNFIHRCLSQVHLMEVIQELFTICPPQKRRRLYC